MAFSTVDGKLLVDTLPKYEAEFRRGGISLCRSLRDEFADSKGEEWEYEHPSSWAICRRISYMRRACAAGPTICGF